MEHTNPSMGEHLPSGGASVGYGTALAHREAGRYADAISWLVDWLAIHPQDAGAYAHLAQVLSLTRQEEAALTALDKALAIDAPLPVVQRNLARLFLKRREAQRALLAAQGAWQREPGDPENHLVLAAAVNAAGEPGKAMGLIESALQLRPRYAEALAMRAQFKVQVNDIAGALQDAELAWSIKPHLAPVAAMTASLRHQARNLPGAIESLEAAVDHDPANVEYLATLGEFKRQDRQTDDAIALLTQAVALAPSHAIAWTNLGTALQQAGRISEARSAYEAALTANPAQAEVANNLGALALLEKHEAEAIRYFRQALEIRPDFARAYINLGNALEKHGDLDQAIATYRQAIHCAPTMADAWQDLGTALRSMDRTDDARQAYLRVLELDPADAGLGAAVWLAVGYYLEGNFAHCAEMLLAAQPITKLADTKYLQYRNYWLYLVELGSYWEKYGKPASAPPATPSLYVVGESHSLAAHGCLVSHRHQQMQCSAQWISGCKQWHLGNAKPNQYKHRFEFIMKRLPPESSILLTIGEIDCRQDEGILSAWKRSEGTRLEDVARATAEGFIRYIRKTTAPHGHRVIVGGIPAIKATLAGKENISALQIELVRELNEVLKALSLSAGMDFLDVHALTDRGDGLAADGWHIDNYHLQPRAVAEAFARHCIETPAPWQT